MINERISTGRNSEIVSDTHYTAFSKCCEGAILLLHFKMAG